MFLDKFFKANRKSFDFLYGPNGTSYLVRRWWE